MKANVQYGDYKGTVTADKSEFYSLSDLLESQGVNTNVYEPIGTKFYPHYKGDLAVGVICIDKQRTTNGKLYIIEIRLKETMGYKQYFDLFQRFEAIVVPEYYEQFEIQESTHIDELRESND